MDRNIFNAKGGDGAEDGDSKRPWEPWNDPTGEGWKGDDIFDEMMRVQELQKDVLLESIEGDFARAYLTVTSKILFDLLIKLGGIPTEFRLGIIRSIIQIGADEVVRQYKANESEKSDGEMMKAVEKAHSKSAQCFFNMFSIPLLSDTFLEEYKRQARKNLKKKDD